MQLDAVALRKVKLDMNGVQHVYSFRSEDEGPF